MVRKRRPTDPRAVAATRAVWETEAFLIDALRHPERHARIPVVRVGYGSFAEGLSEEFWNPILGIDGS